MSENLPKRLGFEESIKKMDPVEILGIEGIKVWVGDRSKVDSAIRVRDSARPGPFITVGVELVFANDGEFRYKRNPEDATDYTITHHDLPCAVALIDEENGLKLVFRE